jgi:hypothetical protein
VSDYYQDLDAPHFDYDMQAVPGIATHKFRGPIPDLALPYMACIGGAQTMGRFTAHAYPQLLSKELSLPCLNLGLGGAGPAFALRPEVLSLLQRAQIVVVQIFSGRSASNSRYDSSAEGRNYGRCVRTGEYVAYEDFLEQLMLRKDQALTRRIVAETREDYAFSMHALARALPNPAVLLWFSQRKPAYVCDYRESFGIANHYPQLIDDLTLATFREAFTAYVECSEAVGLPQPLWHGEPVDATRQDSQGRLHNYYYPSPEMHAAAAAKLAPACRELLQNRHA